MKIGVIGGGAWGTALAQVASSAGEDVLLWALEAEVVASINGAHENALYLPEFPPATIAAAMSSRRSLIMLLLKGLFRA